MCGIFDGYMLVSDMDGTLLSSEHIVSEDNKQAIEYFKNNGGSFAVATGRTSHAVTSYLDQIRINIPAVINNGANIYDFDSKEVLYEEFLEPERKYSIKKFHEDNPDIGIEIYVDECAYIYQKNEWSNRFLEKGYPFYYGVPKDIWGKQWSKVLIIDSEEKIDSCMQIYQKYDSGYIARSGKNLLDIIPSGVSKGMAVSILAEILNIEKQKIITVGDNMNDLPMIENFKYAFSVDNADERIKQAAAFHAPNNDNNPIAYIVQKMEEILKFK